MADLKDKTKITIDTVEVQLGADDGWHMAGVDINPVGYITEDIRTAQTGDDIAARIVRGREISGELIIQQHQVEVFERLLGVPSAAPRDALPVGSFMPSEAMTIHDPLDVGGNGDIHIYEAVFGQMRRNLDNAGSTEWRVPFVGQRDSSGRVWRIGPLA